VTFNRVIALFLLLMASAWVALVNGQPLFMADTTAYVRGPDFAVVYFLGPKFATSWTQKQTLQAAESSSRQVTPESPAHKVSLNSPFDKAVLAGRSIYYGALLYIGHLTSYFWLSVFAQAAIFLYLSYTLTVKCLRLSFFTFACVTLTALIATPVSFFISFLMPDVFASFLVFGTIIIAAFWNALELRDKIFVSAITCFSALAHTSHLLLLICLSLAFAGAVFFVERKAMMFGSVPKRAAVLFALVLVGISGELVFSYATRHTIGADPVRPPFLMARLVADGPGYQFLQKNCATKPYAVCKYIDRLPTPADTFLWSADPKTGVFNVADLATRRTLSAEQVSFVFDVFRSNPIGVIASATRNAIRQLLTVGLNEFFTDQQQIQDFKGKLPVSYFSGLLRSRIIFRDRILRPMNAWYSSIYLLSTIFLVLTLALWPLIRTQKRFDVFATPQWLYIVSITLMAIVFNAAICGALSQPAPRYQARISWICLFVLTLMIARYWETFFSAKNELARRVAEVLPRPLRFLAVGGIGLATDLGTFTIIAALGPHPLIARLGSLAIATMVTWRLNRALTFDPSGRRQHEEAMRYAIVTAVAQGTSYAIFAALVLTVLAALPQIAIVIGAAIGALLSYNGHRLLSFAPKAIYSPP
jgi:putative flippase GtrA